MKPIYVCNIFLPPFSFKTIYKTTYFKRIFNRFEKFCEKIKHINNNYAIISQPIVNDYEPWMD